MTDDAPVPPPLQPYPLEDPGKVLCIAAHPDDLEYGAAAAVAKWTSSGHEVVYVLATSGEAGIDGIDPVTCASCVRPRSGPAPRSSASTRSSSSTTPTASWSTPSGCGATWRGRSGGTSRTPSSRATTGTRSGRGCSTRPTTARSGRPASRRSPTRATGGSSPS